MTSTVMLERPTSGPTKIGRKFSQPTLTVQLWGLGFYSLSFKLEDGKKFGSREADLYRGAGAPIVYLDALAVRHQYQSCGLGTMLLIDSLRRAHFVSQHVAVYGVGLRSLNEKTTAFYERHGFGVVEDTKNPLMVIPIWTVNDLFEG